MQKLIQGDLFDRLRNIPDGIVNLIIIDPPYGQTTLKWDKRFNDIEIKFLFKEYNRITTETGICLVFGREPTISYWRIFGIPFYKYDLTWKKSRKNGYVLSKYKPLIETEKIAVFSKGCTSPKSDKIMPYYPQFLRKVRHEKVAKGRQRTFISGCKEGTEYTQTHAEFPTDIIDVPSLGYNEQFHPNQKPIELMEYLILTYSKLGDIVVDPAFGSGTVLHAAKNLNRRFIGIEKDEYWVDFAKERLI